MKRLLPAVLLLALVPQTTHCSFSKVLGFSCIAGAAAIGYKNRTTIHDGIGRAWNSSYTYASTMSTEGQLAAGAGLLLIGIIALNKDAVGSFLDAALTETPEEARKREEQEQRTIYVREAGWFS